MRRDARWTVGFVLLFCVILQVTIGRLIPVEWLYHYRVDYESVKGNMAAGLHAAIERIDAEIRANPNQEYVILLGDSVTYSGPGGPEQSIGYYLEQWSRGATAEDRAGLAPQEVAPRKDQGRPVKVYNLAEPGMMAGDIYTVLLMLQEKQIPLKKVALNLIYAGFPARGPGQPYFGWLGEELHRLDRTAWAKAGGLESQRPDWTKRFRQTILSPLSIWAYRDVLRARLLSPFGLGAAKEVTDVRPWTEKPTLKELMRQPLYQTVVDPRPLDLTDANPNVYLWNRMLDRLHEAGADVFVYFSPVNQGLMGEWTKDPGYQANVKQIDGLFSQKPIRYVNLESGFMPDSLFTDHLHLIPEGYQRLAGAIGQAFLSH
ncbi:MAG TPA: hypothetical protein VK191_05120 [Symbiobacteriaceae bacterium]|nr:hypothetical protein [Symbiobacteriaceae bacterium]